MKSVSFIKTYTPSQYAAVLRWYRWSRFFVICTLLILFWHEIPQIIQLKNIKKEKVTYAYQAATFITALDHKHAVKKQIDSLNGTIEKYKKHLLDTKQMRDQLITIGRACSPTILLSVTLDKHKAIIQTRCQTSQEATDFCHALVQSSFFSSAVITSLRMQQTSDNNSCLLCSITAVPIFT
jgi:hypothetical protein